MIPPIKYGYARVSPGGKSESVDARARQLTKAGCKKVFRDVPMVTRLDRLARSSDLLNTLAAITDRKAGSDPWATPGPIPRHRTGGLC